MAKPKKVETTPEKALVRAASIPVVDLVAPKGAEWGDFTAAVSNCLGMTARLSNWAVRAMWTMDTERRAGDARLAPKPDDFDLYGKMQGDLTGVGRPAKVKGKRRRKRNFTDPSFRAFRYHEADAWAGCMGSAQSLLRAVEKKYVRTRLETLWFFSRSVMSFRWGLPFPIHKDRFQLSWSDDGRGSPLVTVQLPGCIRPIRDAAGKLLETRAIPARKWTLRLGCGQKYHRDTAHFRKLFAGEAQRCEAALYFIGSSGNTHRRKAEMREAGGGRRRPFTVVLKLVGRFPVEMRAGDKMMLIRTDPSALWVAEVDGRAAWIVNADHVVRRQAAHEAFRQRMAEDLKYERRWPKRKRVQMKEALEKRCEKNNRRLDSFIKETSAMAAGFALRQKVCHVAYDDAGTNYLPGFPWAALRLQLANKLAEHGIALKNVAKKEVAQP